MSPTVPPGSDPTLVSAFGPFDPALVRGLGSGSLVGAVCDLPGEGTAQLVVAPPRVLALPGDAGDYVILRTIVETPPEGQAGQATSERIRATAAAAAEFPASIIPLAEEDSYRLVVRIRWFASPVSSPAVAGGDWVPVTFSIGGSDGIEIPEGGCAPLTAATEAG